MSVIKTALVLADGEIQFITSDTAPASNRLARESKIPLTADGSAVRIASGGSTPGSATALRAAATLTGTYVVSSAAGIDMSGYNSIAYDIVVASPQAGKIAYIKPQWSLDSTNWFDEPVAVNGTAAGTDAGGTLEQSYDYASKVIHVAMDTAIRKGERAVRLARYFRVSCKEAAGVTTATLAVRYQLFNN